MKVKDTLTYLKAHDIKPSAQRLAIMNYLLTHSNHPTVEVIYQALSTKMPTLSRTTVYNTLKLFVGHGASLSLTIDDQQQSFDGDTSLHAHFLCTRCGKIYDLPMDDSFKNQLGKTVEGHIVTELHQYYKGVCATCIKNEIKSLK
ncbi:MAG: transcriptional repressor [Bacteroidaceae bacterium]|nr:transcriptional repressor [Bacteroidaceae bacterium]